MNESEIKELLRSLAWSPWSEYHKANAARLLQELNPKVDAAAELEKFKDLIELVAGAK